MPLDIKREIDEVWLGLEQSEVNLRRDGHKPGLVIDTCMSCYTLSLVIRAKVVYRERLAAQQEKQEGANVK